MTGKISFWRRWLKKIGPGVITGAADDDPSGIATYSQTGAQFGYGQLWTIPIMWPLMTAVQEACARIGAVTGKGLAAVVRDHFSRRVAVVVALLVVVANTINIGADIGALAAAGQLLVPLPFFLWAVVFTAIILLLEIFTSYRVYAKILRWFCLSLGAYILTLFIVEQEWGRVLRATVVPQIEWSFDYFFIITGVLGTTISPYLFFWQASQEVEEEHLHHMIDKNDRPRISARFLYALRWDNFVGMFFSQLAAWCIIVVAAAVLHTNGVTNITTAADAARALEPLVHTFPHAGFLAKCIFATGIIGLGLLGIPVLAGSAAYAWSEVMGWREGLNLHFSRARGFYGVILVATLVGLGMNFCGFNPMRALVFAAVFNGVAAVPLIFVILRVARSEKIMGEWRSGQLSNVLLWLLFGLMFAAAAVMFFTLWA